MAEDGEKGFRSELGNGYIDANLISKDRRDLDNLENMRIISGGTSKEFVEGVVDSLHSYLNHKYEDRIKAQYDFLGFNQRLSTIIKDVLKPVHAWPKIFGDGEIKNSGPAHVSGKNVHLFYTFNFNQFPSFDRFINETKDKSWEDMKKAYNSLSEKNTPYSDSFSVNDGFADLQNLLDSLSRAGAEKIILYAPYLINQRQDRKDVPRAPVTSEKTFSLLDHSSNGKLERIVTSDLHSNQNQGHFNGPVDDLGALPLFTAYFMENNGDNIMPATPDAGGAARASKAADLFGSGLYGIINKERDQKDGGTEVVHVMGDVRDKHVVVYDDIIASGGSAIDAAKNFKEKGAKKVSIAATHGVFNKKDSDNYAEDRLRKAKEEG
ncbi:MAG: ribose-phosphate diphosphokinase, partial [Nanobdellota archaeon]